MSLGLFGTAQHDTTFRLRPYQGKARDAVLAEWGKGVLSTMLVMAVGSGKTETFLSVLDREREEGRLGRAVILAHRKELIEQPVGRIRKHFPALEELGVGQVRAEHDDAHMPVVVATVQTLSVPSRLRRVLDHGAPSHLVIDEAHHGAATSYLSLVNRMKAANPSLRIVGTTATPKGGSGAGGLKHVFQSVAYKLSLPRAIQMKILVPFKALAIELPVSFEDVPISHGDYQDEASGKVLSAPKAIAAVVKGWKENGEDRQTLAFTASVEQAHILSAAFKASGVAAEAVDGTTPMNVREGVLSRFQAGETRIIVNCGVFTEGVDLPQAACLVQDKPTQSDSAYIQMAGRVLRTFPGKRDAIILDFCPQNTRDLFLGRDLLGMSRVVSGQSGGTGSTNKMLRDAFAVLGDGTVVETDDPGELRVRVLDYLDQDPLAWSFTPGDDLATVSINLDTTLAVLVRPTAHYLFEIEGRPKRARLVGKTETWDDAVEWMHSLTEGRVEEKLSAKEAVWRRQPVSDKQRDLLTVLGVRSGPGMTKGEAAQRITHEFARQAIARLKGQAS